MLLDLLAGTRHAPPPVSMRRPTILVFDSGVGGLTVFSEIAARCRGCDLVYAADDAAFPYGALCGDALVARILDVMDALIGRYAPDLVVVACNTASTLVLPHLRARFALPFVGTVPAIKPAAARSTSGVISVLATPGTVQRDYTHELIGTYAAGRRVVLVGSPRLAAFAEAELTGRPVGDDEIAREIAPCFVEDGAARTDTVVLACTHYPLLLDRFRRLAPWPVAWIDPAPAIAQRVVELLGDMAPTAARRRMPRAVFTGGELLTETLRTALGRRGLRQIDFCRMPLAGGQAHASASA